MDKILILSRSVRVLRDPGEKPTATGVDRRRGSPTKTRRLADFPFRIEGAFISAPPGSPGAPLAHLAMSGSDAAGVGSGMTRVRDVYGSSYGHGRARVLRGAVWFDAAHVMRSPCRNHDNPARPLSRYWLPARLDPEPGRQGENTRASGGRGRSGPADAGRTHPMAQYRRHPLAARVRFESESRLESANALRRRHNPSKARSTGDSCDR